MRNRFTLVELLIVISVIAILCSLLLPALGKSREKAYSAKCSGNLHQIGIAFVQYTADTEYAPAASEDETGNFTNNWKVWGAPAHVFGKQYLRMKKEMDWRGTILDCPALKDEDSMNFAADYAGTKRIRNRYSYGYNLNCAGSGFFRKVRRPSRYLLFIDACKDRAPLLDKYWTSPYSRNAVGEPDLGSAAGNYLQPRHSRQCNAAALGGNVVPFRFADPLAFGKEGKAAYSLHDN